MTGLQKYNEEQKNKCKNIVNNNLHITHLEEFYDYMYTLSETTVYYYLSIVCSFINKIDKREEELELNDFTKYMRMVSYDSTPSYQIAVYSALKKYSQFLYTTKVIDEDFMRTIKRPDPEELDSTIEKREKGYLDEDEIKKYINQVSEGAGSHRAKARQEEWKERDLLLIQLFLNTGLRCAAIYKLDVSSIDFENKKLVVRDKGNKRNEVVLSEHVIKLMNEWIEKRHFLLKGVEEEALFISNQRKRMSQLAISNVVHKYAENIQDKNITPHKLRATYGTQLYNKTNDVYFVQQMMNHSNPKTTELYIRGMDNDNKIKAADIMNSLTS